MYDIYVYPWAYIFYTYSNKNEFKFPKAPISLSNTYLALIMWKIIVVPSL